MSQKLRRNEFRKFLGARWLWILATTCTQNSPVPTQMRKSINLPITNLGSPTEIWKMITLSPIIMEVENRSLQYLFPFHLGSFSTSMIMGERVLSSVGNRTTKMMSWMTCQALERGLRLLHRADPSVSVEAGWGRKNSVSWRWNGNRYRCRSWALVNWWICLSLSIDFQF